MAHPVCLRLCTEELYIVSEHWWRRFLLSQEKAMSSQKIALDKPPVESTSINVPRGTKRNGTLEQETTGRRPSNEIRSGLVG